MCTVLCHNSLTRKTCYHLNVICEQSACALDASACLYVGVVLVCTAV